VRSLAELTAGLAESSIVPDLAVSSLALHSAQVRPGGAFLAMAGTRGHGLTHLQDALDRGASAVLWEPARGIEPPLPGVAAIAIPGLGRVAGELAARFHGRPSAGMTVIGVTGTDGKTSVTHFVTQALGESCGVIGTLGYGLGGALASASHTTPDPVRLQAELARLRQLGARTVAMEVSSHALDQGRVTGVEFDLAVLTNLSRVHLDYHGDVESYAAAKGRLFRVEGLRGALLNLDDAFGLELMASLGAAVDVWGYGLEAGRGRGVPTVHATAVHLLADGLLLEVETPEGPGRVRSRLMGRFNGANLLAALGTLLMLGIPLSEALRRLETIRPVPGRMERFGGDGAPTVIVDYAHTPAALRQVLLTLRAHGAGRLWCVFGCGGDRDAGKRPLMGQAASALADHVVITDDNPRSEAPADIVRDILRGVPAGTAVEVVHDRRQAIEGAMGAAGPGDMVLIAGKGHERAQIVGDEARPFNDRDVVAGYLQEAVR